MSYYNNRTLKTKSLKVFNRFSNSKSTEQMTHNLTQLFLFTSRDINRDLCFIVIVVIVINLYLTISEVPIDYGECGEFFKKIEIYQTRQVFI